MHARSIAIIILASSQLALAQETPAPGLFGEIGDRFTTDIPVRTYTSKRERTRWIDLEKSPEVPWSIVCGPVKPGDEIVVRAELGVTNDVATENGEQGSKIFKGEHRYDIQVESDITIAPDDRPRGGEKIGSEKEKVKPQNHHGSLVVSARGVIKDETSKRVNFVARSEVPGVKNPPKKQKLRTYEGAEKPPGGKPHTRVDVGKGRMDVLVLAQGWEASWTKVTKETKKGDLRAKEVSPRERVVPLAVHVGDVKKGDVIDVQARVHCESKNDTPQLISGSLVLAEGPKETKGEKLSAHHGFNVPAGEKATFRKVAAVTVRKDMADAWVNLVVHSNVDENGPRRIEFDDRDSGIEVTHYSPR